MLRWGFLGAADTAARVAPVLRALGHDLAVVTSASLTRARAFAAEQGVRRARGDHDEVLAADDVDVVVVDVATEERESWSVAALEARKHVLCAVPVARDAGSARRVAAVAAAEQRVVMEALDVRFHPRTTALIEMVAGGNAGAVRLVTAARCEPAVDADVTAVAVPAVAAARWLLGDQPHDVRASCHAGTLAAVLAFGSGALATVSAATAAAHAETLQVVTTTATLHVPLFFSATRALDAVIERNGDVVGTWRADPVEHLLRAFAAAVGGAPPALGPDDMLATLEVVDRIRGA